MATTTEAHLPTHRILLWPLRVLTAGALVTISVVHAELAGLYDNNASAALSQGDLFRIEAGVSALAAVLILLTAHRLVWAFAFVVAASALAALLVERYAHVGQIGPIPDMYEPSWYPKKAVTAIAEIVATVTAPTGLILSRR